MNVTTAHVNIPQSILQHKMFGVTDVMPQFQGGETEQIISVICHVTKHKY